jgi:acid phosphatase
LIASAVGANAELARPAEAGLLPAAASLPFTRFPQSADGYATLPTVSIVVPNQQHDMHSGSIADADQWLKDNLGGYANWAQSHNSLLIVTWDEGSGDNHIATIFSGQPVKPGNYPEPVDHYRMLRTLQDMYSLTPTAHAAQRQPITDVWR